MWWGWRRERQDRGLNQMARSIDQHTQNCKCHACKGRKDGQSARITVRLPPDLAAWVHQSGGSELLRELVESAKRPLYQETILHRERLAGREAATPVACALFRPIPGQAICWCGHRQEEHQLGTVHWHVEHSPDPSHPAFYQNPSS